MQVVTKEEFFSMKNILFQKIAEGAIFIHPTDTIYGIGCNALDSKAVKKVICRRLNSTWSNHQTFLNLYSNTSQIIFSPSLNAFHELLVIFDFPILPL